MPNLMETGTAWFFDKLKTNASETVTYTAKAGGSVAVSATIGETKAETLTEDGRTQIQVRNVDFFILAADLDVGGGPVEPQQGDTILRPSVNGVAVTYEVLKVNAQKQFRESDRFGLAYRIHTKEIDRS